MATIWLIRHAKAGSPRGAGGNDLDRPLSDKGQAQAEEIANALASKPIQQIYSSEADRCIATVAILAKRLGLEVQVAPRYTAGSPFTLPRSSDNIVICAHGDNIPQLLGDLGLNAWKCAKASVWELELDDQGALLRAEYTDGPEA